MTLKDEVTTFMAAHPDVRQLDLLLVDMNGIFRGKRVPIKTLKKLLAGEVYLPISTSFLTTSGANAEAIQAEFGSDPDRRCRMVPGSLKRVPWSDEPAAQVILYAEDTDGLPLFSNPRTVLDAPLAGLEALGLKPVVALEYEFFLFETESDPPRPIGPQNGMPRTIGANCYNLEVQSDYQALLDDIRRSAEMQGLSVTGIVCEYGNGQFEVNLNHQADAVKACDDAMLLKRVIKCVAQKHGLLASFMAKPLGGEVGSGLHAHVSLIDGAGDNIFSGEGGDATLSQAAAGLLATMAPATAFFAPNANSYRRFDPLMFAPIVRNWGDNNRRLSVRVPMSDDKNRRIEHRVCGADAAPHLMLACVLAGMLHGIKEKLTPPAALDEFDSVDYADILPSRWKSALDHLKEDQVLKSLLGERFVELYLRIREEEEESFHRTVSQADYDQYLRIL